MEKPVSETTPQLSADLHIKVLQLLRASSQVDAEEARRKNVRAEEDVITVKARQNIADALSGVINAFCAVHKIDVTKYFFNIDTCQFALLPPKEVAPSPAPAVGPRQKKKKAA